MADIENSLERQVLPPAKAVKKEKKAKKEKKEKKTRKTDVVFLPVLVEFTFTFSVIILILLFLTVIGVSLYTGTKLFVIVIRTSVSMLVVGGLLTAISSQISSEVLKADIAKLEEEANQKKAEAEAEEKAKAEAETEEKAKAEAEVKMEKGLERVEKLDEFERVEEIENHTPAEAE